MNRKNQVVNEYEQLFGEQIRDTEVNQNPTISIFWDVS